MKHRYEMSTEQALELYEILTSYRYLVESDPSVRTYMRLTPEQLDDCINIFERQTGYNELIACMMLS